jgi:hypothetical protein
MAQNRELSLLQKLHYFCSHCSTVSTEIHVNHFGKDASSAHQNSSIAVHSYFTSSKQYRDVLRFDKFIADIWQVVQSKVDWSAHTAVSREDSRALLTCFPYLFMMDLDKQIMRSSQTEVENEHIDTHPTAIISHCVVSTAQSFMKELEFVASEYQKHVNVASIKNSSGSKKDVIVGPRIPTMSQDGSCELFTRQKHSDIAIAKLLDKFSVA